MSLFNQPPKVPTFPMQNNEKVRRPCEMRRDCVINLPLYKQAPLLVIDGRHFNLTFLSSWSKINSIRFTELVQ